MFKLLFPFPVAKSALQSRFYATAVNSAPAARKTFKPLNSRKTFLVDSYADLMKNNRIVLIAHRNNLVKSDSAVYRQQIHELGGQFVVIRNSLMKVYLRSENEQDPADFETSIKNQNKRQHPLFPLLNGPTSVIAFKENDPSKIKKLVKILSSASAKEKLFIIGAKVEDEMYDVEKLNAYKELPTKSELQAQLVGLLNVLGGYGLTRTLESASNVLYLTLQSHKDNVENPKSEEGEQKQPETGN